MCYNMICADCLQYNRHFTCFVYIQLTGIGTSMY